MAIRIKFPQSANPEEYETWRAWQLRYAPDSDDVKEYIASDRCLQKQFVYRNPLGIYLYDRNRSVTNPSWMHHLNTPDFNTELLQVVEYPQLVARAMHSVRLTSNPHPPPPRVFAATDENLQNAIDDFTAQTAQYYSVFVSGMNLSEGIKPLLKRKVSFSGEVLTVTGVKQTLINRIEVYDRNLMLTLLREISDTNTRFVDHMVKNIRLNESQLAESVATLQEPGSSNSTDVIRGVLRQLLPGANVKEDLLNVMLIMLRYRDKRVEMAYNEVNCRGGVTENGDALAPPPRRSSSVPFKPSFFFGPEFYSALKNADGNLSDGAFLEFYPDQNKVNLIRDTHMVYMLMRDDDPQQSPRASEVVEEDREQANGGGALKLLILDSKGKKIYYIDPLLDRENPPASLSEDFQQIQDILNPFFHLRCGGLDAGEEWEVSLHPTQFFSHITSTSNSNMAIIHILYLLALDLPVYLKEDALDSSLRYSYLYWTLCGGLPV